MNGYWRKLGRLFNPDSDLRHPKLATHAANPLPILINDNTYRVYFSGRDHENRSSVGAVDIDIFKQEIVQNHYEPFFIHGAEKSFYSEGISIGCTCFVGDKTLMYFMGWKNCDGQHWFGELGAFEVESDLSLTLLQEDPILALSAKDPISLSYPWVCRMADGSFRMWYGSTISWDAGNGEMLHVIKSATSINGINWLSLDEAIPHKIGQAQAFSRPTVLINEDESYDMWFSYRSGNGEAYRIGRATSNNAMHWNLNLKNSGINVSQSGWDSEMIEYPFVFKHKSETFMLYNGNGYGKSGFGLAIWVIVP
jgi:hypothetical protein